MDLQAIKEIEQLKHRYVRALDTKEWSALADTLTENVSAIYGQYIDFDSRDAFVSFLENTLGTHVLTEHQCGQPQIDVTGDRASGTWQLADTTIFPEDGLLLRGSAYYTDRYVRAADGVWRISHTTYERTWEAAVALDDMPGFRLAFNRWDELEPPASA
ncbi:nuclear transport factor 2 family protein [Rhodococcus rhodnii]|uniref:SnoaL-like domain-containing protein n=2 Tax=Rhodococcus rhodnii TaxID=38312 RepID=R7WLV4_9NOCA|nr:nuclear transport factor 2 family protein [Rhodococcus rhodnii]EOM74994.1 hypothetical protein Rrhod_3714 [Rhodococcus rhodnii LMG 5362]TXG90246.1 nuclear transport factor 2 family protein [Rhodococcus rhodnii]